MREAARRRWPARSSDARESGCSLAAPGVGQARLGRVRIALLQLEREAGLGGLIAELFLDTEPEEKDLRGRPGTRAQRANASPGELIVAGLVGEIREQHLR